MIECLCQLFGKGKGKKPQAVDVYEASEQEGLAPAETGVEDWDTEPDLAPDPLTGGYTSPLTLTRSPAMPGSGSSELLSGVPYQRLWELHVPTDRVTPQYPALAQARMLQVVDSCTPNTDWQHNYGYQVIEDTQLPALEPPRYSYAAIDTNDLLDEARQRALATLG